jgi:hypothetical protein
MPVASSGQSERAHIKIPRNVTGSKSGAVENSDSGTESMNRAGRGLFYECAIFIGRYRISQSSGPSSVGDWSVQAADPSIVEREFNLNHYPSASILNRLS